jgi:hypothetical protein
MDALADAIRKLAHNPQLRAEFSQAARLRAEQKFSIEGEVHGYETLYQEIVDRKKILAINPSRFNRVIGNCLCKPKKSQLGW